MEKNLFSDNLGDLYDMQRVVDQREQDGMKLVTFDLDASTLTVKDLNFYQSFIDLMMHATEHTMPETSMMRDVKDFQQELNGHVEKTEDKVMHSAEQFIQGIGATPELSPESSDKFYAKVFQQDVQEQMGGDLGNVYTHLIKEQQDGKEWVAYPDVEKVGKEDLRTFDTKEEARDFVLEKSNVAVVFDFNPIERITDALEPMVQEKIDKSFGSDPDKGSDNDNDKDKGKDKGRDEEMER